MAGKDPVEVDPVLIDLLLFGKEICSVSGSKEDITLGAVLYLWHTAKTEADSDPDHAKAPSPELLTEAARHTGISLLEIDPDSCTVFLSDPLASIDVGSIAKGYAAQLAADTLPDGYVLSLGGNVTTVGSRPDGSGFQIGLQSPFDSSALLHTVSISGLSAVTSGDYQRYFYADGVRYHHIIDPDTLYPAGLWSAVTVIHSDGAVADALSTALFLLDREEGEALLKKYGAEALWVASDGSEQMTEGFRKMLSD